MPEEVWSIKWLVLLLQELPELPSFVGAVLCVTEVVCVKCVIELRVAA